MHDIPNPEDSLRADDLCGDVHAADFVPVIVQAPRRDAGASTAAPRAGGAANR